MDVLVTQDHGLGGCWTSFCNDSKLEELAVDHKMLPKMILSGDEAWRNYEAASDWFGKFGMHEGNRKLFTIQIIPSHKQNNPQALIQMERYG